MRILFDHGTPSGIAKALAGHEVTEAIERGWDRLSNGDLLKAAEAAGFELLLTTDKRIRHQQNLTNRKIAIVVLGNSTWRMVRLHLDLVALAVNAATPGSYAEVDLPHNNPQSHSGLRDVTRMVTSCSCRRDFKMECRGFSLPPLS